MTRKNPSALAVLAVLCALPAFAQPATDPFAAKVDAVFAELKPDGPGCAVGVYRDGEILYSKGYGMAVLEHGVPITPKTVFYIGSISKQLTAGTVALLAQQGKISLDDDIRKHVPEVPDFGTPITVRQVIHHMSGLREKWDLLTMAGYRSGDVVTQKDVLEMVRRQKELNFKPGDEHLYSNTGYDLLPYVVERAAGKPFREYARESLLGPLGMADTRYGDDRTEVMPRRAFAYSPKEGGGFVLNMEDVETVGSGGIYTTIEDFARWDGNLATGRVGGPEWLRVMTTPGTLNDGTKLTYAFGLEIMEDRGLRQVWHNGGLAGYSTMYVRYPDEQLSVAVFCNGSLEPDPLALRVAEVWLAGKFKEPAPAPAASAAPAAAAVKLAGKDLARVTGYYQSEGEGTVRRILEKDGKLFYHRGPGNEAELAPLSADRFQMLGVPVKVEVRFEPEGAAKPERMIFAAEGQKPSVFRPVAPPVTDPAALAAYAGTYESSELASTWTLTLRDGRLLAARSRAGEVELAPASADVFVTPGGLQVRFTRGEGSRITGFSVSSQQARNVRFEKRAG
jgi:CubicO group peptidase (beta-lactamase class C family)